MTLLSSHRTELHASGLSDPTIKAAGLYTEDDPAALGRLLNKGRPASGLGATLVFPFPTCGDYCRVKPERRSKSAAKYLSPDGVPNRLYVPPAAQAAVDKPGETLLITEGEKKALKATQDGYPCLGLVGVWGWKVKDREELIPDLQAIDWAGRRVVIVFDATSRPNREVWASEARLAEALSK